MKIRLAIPFLTRVKNRLAFQRATMVLLVGTVLLTGCGQNEKNYQGYVEGENIYLASPFSGVLKQMIVQRGEQVKEGELLFKLDPYPQKYDVESAASALIRAKRSLVNLKNPRRPEEIAAIVAQIDETQTKINLAAIRVKRNQTLFQKHVIPKDTLDASVEHYEEVMYAKKRLEANLKLAHKGSRIEEIKAQQAAVKLSFVKYQQSQWMLQQKNIYAPADGVIFDTYFREGEYVGAQRSVMSLLTPENKRIEFFVPVQALTTLDVGTPVMYRCEGCKHRSHATISYISPEAEYVPPLIYSRDNRDKLVFRVRARVKDPRNIMPGQPVVVTVSSAKHGA